MDVMYTLSYLHCMDAVCNHRTFYGYRMCIRMYSAGWYTEYIVKPRYYLCMVLMPADFFLYRDIVISRYSLRFDWYFK